MNRAQEIKELIRAIAGQDGMGGLVFVGKVESVDGDSCTVSVGALDLTDVRLTAATDGEDGKMLLTPKEGSMVLVADLGQGTRRDLAVVGYTHIEKIEATCSQITLNGGDLGGLVKIEKLKKNLENLKSYVETMKSAVSSGLTGVGASTQANGANGASVFDGAMATQSIDFEDMEDTKIKH